MREDKLLKNDFAIMSWNYNFTRKCPIVYALTLLLGLGFPYIAAGQGTTGFNWSKNGIVDNNSDILDKMNQKFWINLPSQYNENLKSFISNSITLNYEAAAKFTENFISEQMSQDWWVSEENQYLFIRCAIYYILTNQELYDWSDWNEQRYNEYEIAFEYFLNCEENYKIGLKELIENEKQTAENDLQKSKDDLQKSKDDLQKSKDDLQKSKDDLLRTDTLWLIEIISFYDTYQKNPNLLSQEELEKASNAGKDMIEFCKRDWINYKSVLIKEVWDRKKVDELLKFYWIE